MINGSNISTLQIDPKNEEAWIQKLGRPVREIIGFDVSISGEDVLPGFELDLNDLK